MGIYEKATTKGVEGTRGPRPGAVALYRAILDDPGIGANARGGGIYNKRPIRGGSSWSTHAEGRALDIMFPDRHKDGYALFEMLKASAKDLGVQQILWAEKGWHADKGDFTPGQKTQKSHRDHNHIELTRKAADTLTPAGVSRILQLPVPVSRRILTLGDTGQAVRNLQSKLNQMVDAGLQVDGDFGPATEKAVKDFQRMANVKDRKVVIDGIAGPQTGAALANWVKPSPGKPPSVLDTPISASKPAKAEASDEACLLRVILDYASSRNDGLAELIVEALYDYYLGRAPDARGLETWKEALKTDGLAAALHGIGTSQEAKNFKTKT